MKTLGTLVIFFAAVLAVQGQVKLAPSAQAAGPTEFPHQVSIQVDGNHHCGGALISNQHVLTAGHCVRDIILSPEPSSVKSGRVKVEVGSTRIGFGTKHSIKRISQIRGFNGENRDDPIFMANDIAVITLKTPVAESARVKPISLPAPNSELSVGSKVTISGFGSAAYGGPSSDHLKTSPMKTVSQQECNAYYTRTFRKRITASHVCAKLTPGHGTCQGDSGGPLIQGNTIIGVVSGGDGKCGHGNPDVYTKVSHFIPYIQYELNYDSSKPDGGAGPALALNLDESSSSLQPPVGQGPAFPPGQGPAFPPGQGPAFPPGQGPALPPDHFNPYPGLPGNVQLIDPTTGQLLPPGVVLVDPNTGLPIGPPGGGQFPQYPPGLYPGFQYSKSED